MQRSLVAVQVALCVVIVAIAAAFVQTLQNLKHVDLGFESDQVLMASIDPASLHYAEEDLYPLYARIQDRIAALPDVTSASIILGQPFLLRRGSDIQIDGRTVNLRWDVVAPRFFETMGMMLVSGRDFDVRDTAHTPQVAIVNETLAAEQFPGINPVGRLISRVSGKGLTPMEIIGVVRDVRHRSPRDEPRPVLYAPAAQETFFLSPATIVARSQGLPARLRDSVRDTVARIDAHLAVFDVKTVEQQVAETVWAERLLARIASGFGLMALLLAGIGLFGTLSYAVARQTREIGIRLAIGADARQVQRTVIMQGLALCATGLLIGVPAAVGAVRYLGSLLYGVGPADWTPLAAAAALLTTTAALAAYVPARRASRVNPLEVLRAE